MKIKNILFAFVFLFAYSAFAADAVWIAGDQSSVPGSTFHIDENWSTGVAPTNQTRDTYTINQTGDNVRWISSSSGFYLNGPITIGDTEHPNVSVEFLSDRHGTPTNDDPAQILLGKAFSILGSNTMVYVGTGMNLAIKSDFVLDRNASLSGDGIVSFGATQGLIGDYDYDNLRLVIGNSSYMPVYPLPGNMETRGDLAISSGGSGGVNQRTTLALNGYTVKGKNLTLGILDARPEDGDQSGFGSVDFKGGTLEITGDVVFLSNPDGLKIDGTPLTQDSCLTDSSVENLGGTFILGGSFIDITSKTPVLWNISEVDFILNGDGTAVQNVEVLSADLGDAPTSCVENYCWGAVVIKSGASVKLVDDNVNSSRAAGPEALYCTSLEVEEGAVLDLNGLNVYVIDEQKLDGTVMENGGTIQALTTDKIRHYGYPLGTTDNEFGLGMWIGPMAVGDIDGDGLNELFVLTMDENTGDDDCELFAFNYENGQLTDVEGYPVSDKSIGLGATPSMFLNFVVDDLGNGDGPELFYSNNGWSKIYAIGSGATPRMVSPNENVAYDYVAFILADIDKDGSKELITASRGGNNLRVYNTDTKTLKWSRPIKGNADIIGQIAVGDLDLDGSPEVCAIGLTSDGSFGLTAYRADGSIYMGIDGNTVISNMPFASVVSEAFGGLSIADVTGDGYPEFIFATHLNGLTVMKQDGTIQFTVNRSNGRPNGFALLDVDKDGVYEILYADTLYDGFGNALQTLPKSSLAPYFGYNTTPVLADFTGDQIPEAVYLCSKSDNFTFTRVLCVYDFVAQRMLPGFPIEIKAELDDEASESLWYSGQYHHYSGMTPIVADLDNDGTWEIIIGTGIGVGTTLESPTLNIIDTPYKYYVPDGRKAEDYGWYSYRHGSKADFKFPLYVPNATMLIVK